MADKKESTMKWKVDVTELTAAMQDAKRAISVANAEFKTATAGMNKWQNSTTGLEAKLKQLNSTLPQQKAILDSLEKKYQLVAKEMGEDSTEAQKLKIQIENQKSTITKTEASIEKYSSSLNEMTSASGQLTKTIADQEAELKRLKSSYVDAVLEFGEGSQEAKSLATQIEKLSKELNDNREKELNAKAAADKLDQSYSELGKTTLTTKDDTKELNSGFTVLKGTMANLAADAVKGLISGIKKLGSTAIDAVQETAKIGDEIDKGSQKLAISSDLYQKLSYAMDKSGSSISDVSKGIKNITNELAKAEKGTKGAGSQFEELGITLKNTDGTMKDAETVLMETIDVLADMDDEIARNKAANDIFSKSYSELLPLLNEGSDGIHALMQEAEDYGMVMSNDAVKSSAEYQDSLTKLKGTLGGVRNSIASRFLPSITDIIDGFSDMANGSDKADVKIKKGFADLWKEIKKTAYKVAPEASKIILPFFENMFKGAKNVVTFVTKNFSKIAPVVTTAVVAFTAFKAAMAVTSMITACKTAVLGLEAGVGLATKAQVVWNAAMAANPIGAVVTAVAALTAAIVLLASKESEAEKAHNAEMERLGELKDKIDSNKESWDDLVKAQQEQIDAGMTELSYYDSLKKELEGLVDENGKVKEGYEERASFITGELSKATDEEITMTDGVIDNYKEIMSSLDSIMAKKKAQIILDAQESMYKEAITKQGEALQTFMTVQDEYKNKRAELNALEEEWAQNERDIKTADSDYSQQIYLDKRKDIENNIALKNQELDVVRNSYVEQQNLIDQYAYNIGQYEQNMALAHAGNYEDMNTVTWNYVKDYKNAEDAQKQMLEDSIKREQTHIDELKRLREQSGSTIYDSQIKQSEQQIEKLKQDLQKYTKTTSEGLGDTTLEWKKGLDDQLSQLTGMQIEFKEAGEDEVQMFADGVEIGSPKPKAEMAQMVSDCIKEISVQYTNSKKAGEDLIDGVNDGVSNQRKQNYVFATMETFGKQLLAKFKASLQEKSPSKATDEMGQFLMEGIPQGINKKKDSVLKSAADAGKSILAALRYGMTGEGVIGEGKTSLFGRINSIKSGIAGFNSSMTNSALLANAGGAGSTSNSKNITFNQTINSPKPVDSLTVYKETNSLLFAAKVRVDDV